jgi:hypothetical protein
MAKFLFTMIFVVAACGKADDKPADNKGAKAQVDVDEAKLHVKKLNFESYPMWASKTPDKACPASIGDLEGGAAKDPWGNPYKMLCGPNAPAGAHGFAVLSFGPDGIEGTPDDIKSWEK